MEDLRKRIVRDRLVFDNRERMNLWKILQGTTPRQSDRTQNNAMTHALGVGNPALLAITPSAAHPKELHDA